MPRNPYFEHTAEWHAYESGISDVGRLRILGHDVGPDVNEDHLVMQGQAYIAGVRAARTRQGDC